MNHLMISQARIYGPEFDAKLVADAAQRMIADDHPPIIAVYGADAANMETATESLGHYGQVVDENSRSWHFTMARSLANPVFVRINPADVIWDYIGHRAIYHGQHNTAWITGAVSPSTAAPSITIDLDASQIVGPESVSWDGGVRMFPTHPIKRQRNITQHVLNVKAPEARRIAQSAAINMVREAMTAAPGSSKSLEGCIETITKGKVHLTYVPWAMGLHDFDTMVKLAGQGLELPTLGDSTILFSASHDGQLDALTAAQR